MISARASRDSLTKGPRLWPRRPRVRDPSSASLNMTQLEPLETGSAKGRIPAGLHRGSTEGGPGRPVVLAHFAGVALRAPFAQSVSLGASAAFASAAPTEAGSLSAFASSSDTCH